MMATDTQTRMVISGPGDLSSPSGTANMINTYHTHKVFSGLYIYIYTRFISDSNSVNDAA